MRVWIFVLSGSGITLVGIGFFSNGQVEKVLEILMKATGTDSPDVAIVVFLVKYLV